MEIKRSYVLFLLVDGAYERGKTYRRRHAALRAHAAHGGQACVKEYARDGSATGSRWLVSPPIAAPVWIEGDGVRERSQHMLT